MAKEVSKDNKKEKNDNKKFFKEFKAELKRVSWPTRKQLVNNTIAVVSIVVIVAVIVFVLDVIFENMNKFGVEKLKAIVTSSSSEENDSDDHEHIDTTNTVENTVVPEVTDNATGTEEESTANQAPAEDTTNVVNPDATATPVEQNN
jgi:preprotein translocase subunit SecE